MEPATSSNDTLDRDDSTRRRKCKYCPHCSQLVGHSTFYRHRKRYCDSNGQWNTTASMMGGANDETEEICFARGDLELQESFESKIDIMH